MYKMEFSSNADFLIITQTYKKAIKNKKQRNTSILSLIRTLFHLCFTGER